MKLTASIVLFLIPLSVVFVKCKDPKDGGPERLDAQEFCKRVAIKLWVSFLLRENLLKFFENKPSTKDEAEWYYSNKYLYDALKYREIDTFPLISAYECFLNQEPVDQLETALSQLSSHSPKYIKCAIDVVLEDIKTNRNIPETEWDLTTDLQDVDGKTIEQIYKPIYDFGKQKIYKVNSADKALDAVWSRIYNGYRPTQRLIGVMLLSVPMSSRTLSDQIYVGEFLYLEKIPAETWEEVLRKSEIKTHTNMIKFLRATLSVASGYLDSDIDLGVSPTKYIDNLPDDVADVKRMFEKVSESLLEFKSSYRSVYGRSKRFVSANPSFQNYIVDAITIREDLPEDYRKSVQFLQNKAWNRTLTDSASKPVKIKHSTAQENWETFKKFADSIVSTRMDLHVSPNRRESILTSRPRRETSYEQHESDNDIFYSENPFFRADGYSIYDKKEDYTGGSAPKTDEQPTESITELDAFEEEDFVALEAPSAVILTSDTLSTTQNTLARESFKNRSRLNNDDIQRSLNRVITNLNQKNNRSNGDEDEELEETTLADAKIFFLSQGPERNRKIVHSLEPNYENYDSVSNLQQNKDPLPIITTELVQENVITPSNRISTTVEEDDDAAPELRMGTDIKESHPHPVRTTTSVAVPLQEEPKEATRQAEGTLNIHPTTQASRRAEEPVVTTKPQVTPSPPNNTAATLIREPQLPPHESSSKPTTTSYDPLLEISYSENDKPRKKIRSFLVNLKKSIPQIEEFLTRLDDQSSTTAPEISDYLSNSIRSLVNHVLRNRQVISKMPQDGAVNYDKFLPKTIPNTEEFRQISSFRNYISQPGLAKSLNIEWTETLTDFETFLLIIKRSLETNAVPKTSVVYTIMKTYMQHVYSLSSSADDNHSEGLIDPPKWTTQLIETLPQPKTDSQEAILDKIKEYLSDYESQDFESLDMDDLQLLINILSNELHFLFQGDVGESDYEYLWPLINYYLNE